MSRLRAEPTRADYAAMSWPDAFTALCGKLAAEYPFTEWKRIDWRRQCSELAPRVAEAARRGDRKGYYRALRELAWSVPDGHVGLEGDDGGLERQETSGSFGLALVELDPRPGEGRGRVVASRIEPGGPAARAGMLYGAELLAWSSTAPSPGREPASPIRSPASLNAALSRVPLLWTESPPATAEARRLAQLRFLVRAPVGSRVTVSFRNRGSAAPAERTLAASPAGEEPRQVSPIRKLVFGCPVTSRTLPGGEGYLRVELELPTLPCPFPERAVRSALDGFAESGAAGVVLDVRGNGGGMDTMVPRIVAFFIPARRIYEIPGAYDRSPRRFVPLRDAAIWLVPRSPRHGGRVAVLVDEATVSSGEGFPLVLQGLPNVAVFGYRATAGFFAIGQKTVRLPGDLAMWFPQAQSLDAAGRIQVDSDASGRGGVAPDHRVAFDERALDASLRGGHDVVLEAAVRWLHGG
jgi:carboxyl-terminal processing protease